MYLQESIGYILPMVLFLGIYTLAIKRNAKIRNICIPTTHYLGVWLLALYLCIVFASTISPVYGFSGEMNLDIRVIPFHTIGELIREDYSISECVSYLKESFINIAMFVPLGLGLPLLWRRYRQGMRVILCGFYLSTLIEAIQLFLVRVTDIDDIIQNTLGITIGYCCYKLLQILNQRIGQGTVVIKKKKEIHLPRYLRYEAELVILVAITLTFLVGYLRCNITEEDKKMMLNSIEINEPQNTRPTGFDQLQDHEELYQDVSESNDYAFNKDLSAGYAILINASENKILFGKNEMERVYPASTTKLVTALTTLKYCKEDELVQVGDEINLVEADASRAGLYKGQILSVKMLLEGLLLPSGNDAAYVLANYVGTKIKGNQITTAEAISYFVDLMNETAREIGANQSYFLTPDGYDMKGQYTTAYDLAIIGDVSLENSTIREIVKQYEINEYFLSGEAITWTSSNELLNRGGEYYYPGTIGLKTGSTDGAGRCLISAASFNGEVYLSVVMKATEKGRWEDSITLLEYAKELIR